MSEHTDNVDALTQMILDILPTAPVPDQVPVPEQGEEAPPA
jgi:hypothetical protein